MIVMNATLNLFSLDTDSIQERMGAHVIITMLRRRCNAMMIVREI